MEKIIQKLFDTAEAHGTDSGEPDHTVGDLQGLLARAWELMTVSQKRQLILSNEVDALIEVAAYESFDADALLRELNEELSKMQTSIDSMGYKIKANGPFFYWETAHALSEDFHDRADALVDAYRDSLTVEKEVL